ncbi:MAG: hypothetical protein KHZ96_07125 [Coprobacillus sp.]|nr:hypothetical protein [Coprobacillus sp.]
MRFSEAIEHLLNGEYIRRSKWHKDYYIKLEDEVIVDSDEMNTSVSTEDIIANDWEIYQPKLEVGTVVQYNDGTIGIMLDSSKSDKEYTVLNENGCVETLNETQISLINIDDGRVSLHVDSASKKLKSLVLSLQMISELVNEDIW